MRISLRLGVTQNTFCLAHGRMALSLYRCCTRFFAAIWLRHRSKEGFAGTEPAKAPHVRTV